jgi:hypothetical protein
VWPRARHARAAAAVHLAKLHSCWLHCHNKNLFQKINSAAAARRHGLRLGVAVRFFLRFVSPLQIQHLTPSLP